MARSASCTAAMEVNSPRTAWCSAPSVSHGSLKEQLQRQGTLSIRSGRSCDHFVASSTCRACGLWCAPINQRDWRAKNTGARPQQRGAMLGMSPSLQDAADEVAHRYSDYRVAQGRVLLIAAVVVWCFHLTVGAARGVRPP